jgi:hypothetical protein
MEKERRQRVWRQGKVEVENGTIKSGSIYQVILTHVHQFQRNNSIFLFFLPSTII